MRSPTSHTLMDGPALRVNQSRNGSGRVPEVQHSDRGDPHTGEAASTSVTMATARPTDSSGSAPEYARQ